MKITKRSCAIEQCDRVLESATLCRLHWHRFKSTGDPLGIKKYDRTGNQNGLKHGGHTVNKPEYNSWRAMRERCSNPKYRAYDRYGGRGIKVCERWDVGKGIGFTNFLTDMGKKPTKDHSIDRIDSDGDYSPDNCRWATQTEQVRNSTRAILVTINGVPLPVTRWLTTYGISTHTYYKRTKGGMSPEQAITFGRV